MALKLDKDPANIFFRCVEDSRETMMITDVSGRLTYINQAWTQTYEYTPEEALGKTPSLIHSGLHDKDFYQQMWDEIKDPKKGSWKGELTNRSKSGKLVPVLLSITPFKSKSGTIRGYMGIALNLSEKKEL